MAVYAIIEESGGQRRVEQGESILIDLVGEGQAKAGDKIKVEKVLVVGEAGGGAKLGTPYVGGASVTLEITEPVVMGDKIHIYKYRAKKQYRRKTGHRQRFTGAKVASIQG
jgi:ribosomal protein L21